MITKQEIEHLAKLSRLELKEEEVERFEKELSSILDYVANLQKVNTENIEPVSQITGLSQIKRRDEVAEFLNKEGIFENAPLIQDNFFKIKTVLGKRDEAPCELRIFTNLRIRIKRLSFSKFV